MIRLFPAPVVALEGRRLYQLKQDSLQSGTIAKTVTCCHHDRVLWIFLGSAVKLLIKWTTKSRI